MTIPPIFRNPDKVQRLPIRDLIREHVPPDYVVEDLDLVIRTIRMNRPYGKFREIEVKHGVDVGLTSGQRWTFGLRDTILRRGDPDLRYYDGFYRLNLHGEDVENQTHFTVNDVVLSREEFIDWLKFGSTTVASVSPCSWITEPDLFPPNPTNERK